MIDDREQRGNERRTMFCPKCGQLNVEKAASCEACGAVLRLGEGGAAAMTALYAGFWKRFAAFVIDYFILMATFILVGAVVGLLIGRPDGPNEASDGLSGIAGAVMWWLYYACMESSSRQATLGKIAVRIKVVDRQGGRISFARATGRHFAKLLSSMILFIGYLMAGLTSRKQALHDLVAGCLVINREVPADLLRQDALLSRN